MSTIEELKARVEEVEQRFGLISEQNQHYSDRLIGLMAAVEDGLNRRQAQVDEMSARLARAAHENEELREMLQGLLRAVEDNGRTAFAAAMLDLESRVSALLPGEDAAEPVEANEEIEAVATEPEPVEAVDEFEAVTEDAEPVEADKEFEAVTEDPEPVEVDEEVDAIAEDPEPIVTDEEMESVAEEPAPDEPDVVAEEADTDPEEPAENAVETLIGRIRDELEAEVATDVTPAAVEEILHRMRAEEADHEEAQDEPVAATG